MAESISSQLPEDVLLLPVNICYSELHSLGILEHEEVSYVRSGGPWVDVSATFINMFPGGVVQSH